MTTRSITTALTALCLSLALLISSPLLAGPNDETGRRDAFDAATAYAFPLKKIKIDGLVDDWPKDAIRYPIINNFGAYGPTHGDQDGYDPSDDLAAYFMTGYDAQAGVVYLAVVVRDDQHIIGRDCYTTDAIEIYFDGKSRGVIGAPVNRWPVNQYVAVPGDGSYRGLTATGVENPIFNGGPFEQTMSSFAATQLKNETIYEFALTVYDQFPNAKTELKPGKRIGMDVVVVDKDMPAESKPRWTVWGPTGAYKLAHSALLGDLVLLGEATELGELSGTVSEAKSGKPMPGAFIEAWTGDERAGYTRADERGRYAMRLPSGKYKVQTGFAQGIATTRPSMVDVRASGKVALDPRVEWLALPPVLGKMLETYSKLSSYQDEAELAVAEVEGAAGEVVPPLPISFAVDRRAGVRISTLGPVHPVWNLTFDGRTLSRSNESEIPLQIAIPRPILSFGTIDPASQGMCRVNASMPLHRLQASGAYPHQLALSPDPRRDLLRGLIAVRVKEQQKLGDQPVTVVELTKSLHTVISGLHTGYKLGVPLTMRLSITDADGLIRRSAIDYPAADMANFAYNTRTRALLLSSEHRKIVIDPKLKADIFSPQPGLAAPAR